MIPPKYARNKTALARALNLGRNKVVELSQEVDFPTVSANGMYDIERVRKWMKQHKTGLNGSERETLQTALLAAKLERERYELGEAKDATRNEIRAEFTESLVGAMRMLRGEFDRMVRELAPRLESRTSGEIRKMWRERQALAYSEIVRAFNKVTGASVTVEETVPNVVVFDQRKVANAS